MIRAALELELRTLLRSPLRLLVVVLILAVGVFTIVQGQRDLRRWEDAIEAGQAEGEESIAEARAYFEAGEAGPADRAWVDLSKAHWQDMYAATRVNRRPAPLAGIAYGSAESAAVSVRLNRFADPLLAAGNRIENPALVATGGLDLVTVLALLLPLMLVALGVEVGGYERVTGVLPLIRVQSGRGLRWIRARCLAVGLIVATLGSLLALVATLFAGAGLVDGLVLALLVLAYVAVWTALLSAVALVARNPSQGAIALGTAWIVSCVLIPALAAERSAALAADDFALDLTVDKREAKWVSHRELGEDALKEAVLARFPALADEVPELDESNSRAARDALSVVDLEARMRQREERGETQRELVAVASLATPTLAFTRALEGLAGRGPEAAQAFRAAVVEGVAMRSERSIAATWRGEPLEREDFDELVAASSTTVVMPSPRWGVELVVLLGWVLALLGGASLLARRSGQNS